MAAPSAGAVIIYGRGGTLGSFTPFAESLSKRLVPTYTEAGVVVKNIERRDDFIDFVHKPGTGFSIKELHIFSHSIGGGLFPGYQDPAIGALREAAYEKAQKAGRDVTYDEVIAAEVGAVFTDNFVEGRLPGIKAAVRANLASGATLKIWGCNSGIAGWVYTDDGGPYYWQALNTRNVPKPSIAQAFADYFNVPVQGATSGSHIEVQHKGKWITSDAYKKQMKKWPSGALPHRLHPDRGNFQEFTPVGASGP